MHLAEEDEFISKPAQAEIKAALASKPNATVYSYPGQYHAFARHNGAHYNAAAATLANGGQASSYINVCDDHLAVPRFRRLRREKHMANTTSAAHVRVIEETPAYWRVVFDYPPFNIVDARHIRSLQDLLARMNASPSLRSSYSKARTPSFTLPTLI